MRASFERGDPTTPRGHALLYFRETLDRAKIRATYVVVAPIQMDFAKYIPPMFAGQLAGLMPSGPTAIPLPPIPESVSGLDWLERLAEARDDDLLDGGALDPSNPQQMMLVATELAAEYASLWTEFASRLAEEPARTPELESNPALPDVENLLLSVMSDNEKVGRLARLAGTLRYASEVRDGNLASETEEQIERIERVLPASYRVSELRAVAQRTDQVGARLLELYVQRCYKLAAEQYDDLPGLEQQIAQLEGREAQ